MNPMLPYNTREPIYNSALSQDVTVSFDTSSSSWKMECSKAVLVANDLFVLWQLSIPGQTKKCDIGVIRETVRINLPDNTEGPINIHNFVLGKDWNWGQDGNNLHFISSEADFNDKIFSVDY